MHTAQAAELVLVIFSRMNKDERLALVKILRSMRKNLDIKYPNGMDEKSLAGGSKSQTNLILPGNLQ